MRNQRLGYLSAVCSLWLAWGVVAENGATAADEKKPAAVVVLPVEPKLGRPVDFERDVFPILDAKCIACHNVAIAENGLNMEDLKGILKGGKRGTSVIAKDPEKSLLYKLASRAAQPAMPPLPNKVEAAAITPEELGILKQWILEGASAGMGASDKTVQWQPLPSNMMPIYSVALTSDGQYAACGRGNQISVYHIPTGEVVGQLSDPSLLSLQYNGKPMYEPGSSHRDFVHSLAFSPDGRTLASGSYREVKLWTRPAITARLSLAASTGPVSAVAVSRDDKWLATASADNSIKLWNLADGQPGKVLAGHTAPISSLQFSADGSKLLSASHDKSIRLWNVADGASAGRIDTPAAVNGVVFNLDGTKIVSAGADNQVRVWTTPTAVARQLAAPAAPVVAIKTSPDKKWLALAEADGKVNLIDLATGQVAKSLAGHAGQVTSLAFTASSARLVSGGVDKTVRVWDVATGQPVAVVSGANRVDGVAIHPSGNQVAAGYADGQTVVWKIDAAPRRAVLGDNGAAATIAVVSPDGKLLATDGVAAGKPVVLVREIASGNIAKTLAGHDAAITAIAFSADNSKIVTGSADKTARVWNLADSKELVKFPGHGAAVTGVAFNSNAQQVVSGAADNTLKLWNVADAKETANFAGHSGAISGVALTPNNQTIVSGSADQTIRLWDPTGKQTASIAHGQPVTSLALSRDGNKIAATGTDNNVKLYQPDGKVLFTLAGHAAAAKSVSFSADNKRLASSAADHATNVWDVATGALLQSVPAGQPLTCATFANDDNTLVVGTADKAIAVVALNYERALPAHAKAVTAVAYTPAGDGIFTASEDGTLRRYVTASGAQQFTQNHGAPIHDLAVSTNGALLATAGENNQVRVWNSANGGAGPKPVLEGFTAPVRSVCFSPDDQFIASGTANNLVVVHQVATGLQKQLFAEHAGAVEAIAAGGADAKLFISSSADKTVKAWGNASVQQMPGHTGPVNGVALVTPAGTQVLSGSDDGTVRVWDINTAQQIRSFNHGSPVKVIAARPDGLVMASAGAAGGARLWDMTNGQQLVEIKGDVRAQHVVAGKTADEADAKLEVTSTAAAVPIAEKLVTEKAELVKKSMEAKVAADKAIVDTAEAAKKATEAKAAADKLATDTEVAAKAAVEEKAKAEKAVTDTAAAAKAAMDKAVAAKAAFDKATTDKALEEAKVAAEKAAAEAAANAKQAADAKPVAEKKVVDTAAAAKKAADAKVVTDKAAVDTAAASKKAVDEQKRSVDAIVQAEKSQKDATEGVAKAKATAEAAVAAQKAAADAVVAAKAAAVATEKPIRSLCFSQDNKEIATGDETGLVCTWHAKTGMPFDVIEGHKGPVLALAATASRQLISGSADQTVKAWVLFPQWNLAGVLGPKKGTPLDLAGSSIVDRVLCLDFSPDGKLLATGGGDPSRSGELILWDVAQQTPAKVIAEAHSDTVFGVDFSRDGKFLASCAADKFVKVFDVASAKHVKSFEGHTNHVLDVTWRGDGKVLASAGADNAIKIWNMETGEQERTFGGYTKQVTSIQFIGRGHNLVSCSGEKRVAFHLADNGSNFRNFPGPVDFMFSAAASDNEEWVIAGGQDGVLRVWNGKTSAPIQTFDPPKPAPANQQAKAK